MAKKPFAIRVEETVSTKFRALSLILNVDSAVLLGRLVAEKEASLSESERKAYEAVLAVWREEEENK